MPLTSHDLRRLLGLSRRASEEIHHDQHQAGQTDRQQYPNAVAALSDQFIRATSQSRAARGAARRGSSQGPRTASRPTAGSARWQAFSETTTAA
ncbi:hypothetical protein I553_3232 [Mycobacterium xenopi 4042]|uniref:Uncharacterized protein n=1 Tax=Mycobacterium xenopi 4042 TaxID=1299334 RepID=X8E6A0_MYCXE|nr:hypothetical protein I553_3232 [Mycobacterium xenopi 4042]